MKQYSDDYKISAVKYYLDYHNDIRPMYDIFNCKYKSLPR